jgi:hypothetical protein
MKPPRISLWPLLPFILIALSLAIATRVPGAKAEQAIPYTEES